MNPREFLYPCKVKSPPEMFEKSKNLVFIFDENEAKYDISSNLVRLYMNRCIIDEDEQFEILGVSRFKSKKLLEAGMNDFYL